MTENVTEQLASIVTRIGFDDLPQDVVKGIKWILLDSVGCALGASQTDKARIASELVEELGGQPQASVIGGHRTSYALEKEKVERIIESILNLDKLDHVRELGKLWSTEQPK